MTNNETPKAYLVKRWAPYEETVLLGVYGDETETRRHVFKASLAVKGTEDIFSVETWDLSTGKESGGLGGPLPPGAPAHWPIWTRGPRGPGPPSNPTGQVHGPYR